MRFVRKLIVLNVVLHFELLVLEVKKSKLCFSVYRGRWSLKRYDSRLRRRNTTGVHVNEFSHWSVTVYDSRSGGASGDRDCYG
jgi:hypothetical protein